MFYKGQTVHKIKLVIGLNDIERFDRALYAVCDRVKAVLEKLPQECKKSVEEIRLRVGKPVCLTVGGKNWYLTDKGLISAVIQSDTFFADSKDLADSFRLLCAGSVYAHENELQNGFVIMKNGCRAGVCGTFKGTVQEITSLNIRIAREIFSAAQKLIQHYRFGGFLICGPPLSGKTTVLRDFIRRVSNKGYSVSVIDSRGEISGAYSGIAQNDLGLCTDVLIISDKALGCEMALRTMNPKIIAFDEIGTEAELSGVLQSFNSGVSVITTAHITSKEQLLKRPVTKKLIYSGAIEQIAVLSSNHQGEFQIFDTEDLI